MPSSIYLSGPSENYIDPSLPLTNDWKSYAISNLLKAGITVANPLDLDLKGFVSDIEEPTASVKHSLNLIDKADSVLSNIIQISESATMEIFYAHRQGKQVVVVGKEPFSPWIMLHSEARFQRLKEAIDYLVTQPSTLDALTWSSQFEAEMKKKSDRYPPPGEPDFEYYGGTLPILVVAPHATSYFKEGNLFTSESYTGTIAVLLHKLTGCHALISSYCLIADPVYYLMSPYVNFLSRLVKRIHFKLVLVLHGIQDWNSNFNLLVTSWNKASLINKTEYLNLLINMLQVKDFTEIGLDDPGLISSDKKTINHLAFEDFNIPTIRMEIHKRYRLPQLQPTFYSNLYNLLVEYIRIIGKTTTQ